MGNSMKAKLVNSLMDDRTPGAYKPYTRMGLDKPSNKDPIAGLNFWCPCGGGHTATIKFKGVTEAGWTWDNNLKSPTVTPSIRIKQREECWHGYLTNGEWVSC